MTSALPRLDNPHNIKKGQLVALTIHGDEHIIEARDVFEYDGFVRVTDETGFLWQIGPTEQVRIIR